MVIAIATAKAVKPLAANIADAILINPPIQGFLTISNAWQWRLYGKVIELAGQQEGVIAVYKANQ